MKPFDTPALLSNTHIQSLLSSVKLRLPLVKLKAKEMLKNSSTHILDCGAGVRLMGIFSGHTDSNPLVILIHGWEGSADSVYLLAAAAYLWDRGFDVFRLNLRDHGPTHHLNPELFNSCRMDEVVGAIRRITELFPRNRIFLGGFSLGGNFALRVAVRSPEAGIPITQTVAICPLLNPKRTMDALENGFWGYHWYFLRKWRRSLAKKRNYFPDLTGMDHLSRFKSLTVMTDYFVRHHTEFPDMISYLNGYAITGDALASLTIPSHIIASKDDPVIPAQDLENLANPPALTIEILPSGGHCGFIRDWRLNSWADERMAQLFESAISRSLTAALRSPSKEEKKE
jgi:uncharacterized protein